MLWMLWVWWHTAGVAVLYAGERQNRQVLQHEDGYMASRHTQRAAYIHMYIWGFGWVPLGMQRVYMALIINLYICQGHILPLHMARSAVTTLVVSH